MSGQGPALVVGRMGVAVEYPILTSRRLTSRLLTSRRRCGGTAMPEIILELAEGRTVDQKRQIAKEFTDTIVRVCGVDPEAVVVIIHESPRTDKAKGSVLFCDR